MGLTLDGNTGVISGKPTQAGPFTVTVTATDRTSSANGGPFQSAPKSLSLTVAPPTVTVTTASLINARVQTNYSAKLGASGGSAPYSFTATGLPQGLSLNAGTISGTPTQAGPFTVTIFATDNTSSANGGPFKSALQTLTLTVAPPTVTVATVSLPTGSKGTSYAAPLAAFGGTGSYSFTATGLPQGLSVTGGAISGIPTQSGTFPVTITATDSTPQANGGPFQSVPRSLTLAIAAGKPVSS